MKNIIKVYPLELLGNKVIPYFKNSILELNEKSNKYRSANWFFGSVPLNYTLTNFYIKNSKQDNFLKKNNTQSRMFELSSNEVVQVELLPSDHLNFPFLISQYAIAICDINNRSNVQLILDVFSKTKNKRIVIIGNWNQTAFGCTLKLQYSGYENIVLLDEITDYRVINLLIGNAVLYIQFNNLRKSKSYLYQAMAHSVPVLAYKTIFNLITTGYRASYFSHAKHIISFFNNNTMESLKKNSISMKELANKN